MCECEFLLHITEVDVVILSGTIDILPVNLFFSGGSPIRSVKSIVVDFLFGLWSKKVTFLLLELVFGVCFVFSASNSALYDGILFVSVEFLTFLMVMSFSFATEADFSSNFVCFFGGAS